MDKQKTETSSEETTSRAKVRAASKFKTERVRWLWDSRLPFGKLAVIEGDPGQGKSTVTMDIAARLSRGAPMPFSDVDTEPAATLVLSAEDAPTDTIKPRLEAAGADLDKIFIFESVTDASGMDRPVGIPEDIDVITDVVRETGAKFVIVDPLMAFLRGVSSTSDQGVRGALWRLQRIAERSGASIAVVRHLTKGLGGNAIYRGSGSIGIIGAARVAMVIGPTPDETAHAVAVHKSNISKIPNTAMFDLVDNPYKKVAFVEWREESVITADDIFAGLTKDWERESAQEVAAAFLGALLAKGPMAAVQALELADEEGIAERTLRRAMKDIRVHAFKRGNAWFWELPTSDQEGGE